MSTRFVTKTGCLGTFTLLDRRLLGPTLAPGRLQHSLPRLPSRVNQQEKGRSHFA